MSNNISNGWHNVAGFRVYVENGVVKRGELEDINGNHYTAWIYRKSRYGSGWDNISGFISVSGFRSSVKRGTVTLF